MSNIIDKLAQRARVKVYKPSPGSDDRKKLCGEPLQKGVDQDGKEAHFFVIPAGQADYINKAFGKYRVSEPFIPGADDPNDVPMLEKEYVCQHEGCGRTFNSPQGLRLHQKAHQG